MKIKNLTQSDFVTEQGYRRYLKFESYKNHAWLHRDYDRLSQEEIHLCWQFIKDTEFLDRNEFANKVNRWYLGDANKPKRWTIMWGLVSQAQDGI